MGRLTNERKQQLKVLQEKINYSFNDILLLNRALTHSSYANEHKKANIKYNERLEFLGDSVLSVIVSDYIFNKFPDYPEGELTKLRASVVCESSLSYVAKNLDIGRYLLLGKGEEATGGRERVSILADSFEALIGAIYIDGSLSNAKVFILQFLKEIIDTAVNSRQLFADYKTMLQETLQKSTKARIEYKVIKEEGPDHNKTFFIQVTIENEVLGSGTGRSKKEAEQSAAQNALVRIGAINE